MIHHTLLKANKKSETLVFERWMEATAQICDKFWEYADYFYPFHDNEASAVSLLGGGAARAGFLPVSEYRLRKRGKKDKRLRREGRADLWFIAGSLAYSFEFKRAWDDASLANLHRVMKSAQADIQCLPTDEYDHAYAGLIAPVYDEADEGCYEKFVSEVDIAFKVGNDAAFDVYFYFDRCQ